MLEGVVWVGMYQVYVIVFQQASLVPWQYTGPPGYMHQVYQVPLDLALSKENIPINISGSCAHDYIISCKLRLRFTRVMCDDGRILWSCFAFLSGIALPSMPYQVLVLLSVDQEGCIV